MMTDLLGVCGKPEWRRDIGTGLWVTVYKYMTVQWMVATLSWPKPVGTFSEQLPFTHKSWTCD